MWWRVPSSQTDQLKQERERERENKLATNIKNGRGDSIINVTDIERIIRKYDEYLYPGTFFVGQSFHLVCLSLIDRA